MAETTASKPITPRRSTTMQALSAFFRTPTLLRTPTSRPKRARSRTPSSPSGPRTVLPAVVLQTYSVSTDSIVLTSLPSAPFCCHEDLLTMPRVQLEGVVRALNERLPRRLRIAPEDDFWWNHDLERPNEDDGISRMSEAEMRRRIEELVGIRSVNKNRVSKTGLGLRSDPAVPSAPKAIRTRDASWKPYESADWEMEVDSDERRGSDGLDDALLGSSPLAFRSRTRSHPRGRSDVFPRLAILQEENEGGESKEAEDEDDETRPSKKQRRSFETINHDDRGPEVINGARGSRLIENIDVSASSLFTREGDSTLDSFAQPEQKTLAMSDRTQDDDKQSKERQVQAPVLRRRSARIALKQASSANPEKTTDSDARTFSPQARSSRSSAGSSTHVEHNSKNSSQPREFTIRLPFTSTPPNLKPTSWTTSAPRILRSQSQRLSAVLKPSKSAKEKTMLGRSRSERLPRALDLTFVTVNRPRYRLGRRQSKGKKEMTTGGKPALEVEQGVEASSLTGWPECENVPTTKDIEKSQSPITTTSSGVYAFPPALFSSLLSLTPRSRAPSTSTVGSMCGNGDSPARSMTRSGNDRQMNSVSATNDVVADGVQAALGRMVVD